jgi:hypothetical protein
MLLSFDAWALNLEGASCKQLLRKARSVEPLNARLDNIIHIIALHIIAAWNRLPSVAEGVRSESLKVDGE